MNKKEIIIDRYNKRHDNLKVDCIDISWKVVIGPKGGGFECTKEIYTFLFHARWGWIETFHKDEDYQREFENWMDENNHGGIDTFGQLLISKGNFHIQVTLLNGIVRVPMTEQMLTGYIKQFMEEKYLK